MQKYIGSAGIVNSIVNNGDGTYLIEYISNQETYLFLADEKDKLILLEGLNIIPQKLNLQLITNGNEVISDSSTVKAILTNVKGTVKWQITGDKDVVSISSTKENIITVTPKKVGVTSLTATLDDGNIDTCEITVTENGDVYKIGTLSPDSMTIVHNEPTVITTPYLRPSATTEILQWTSSDESIVTIRASEDGRSATVTGIKNGTATITASARNGDKETATITVSDLATVTYKSEGKTYSIANTVRGGKVSAQNWPVNPHLEGCIFEGWYDAENGGIKYDSSSTINGHTTLYARWKVTVAFNSNGGTDIPSQEIAYGANAIQPENPTLENNTFVGWYSNEELTAVFDFNTEIKRYTILYAKWVEVGNLDSSINAEKYGYRVKGYQSSNYNGYWRLFYQDENNTYIIADPTDTTYKLSDQYSSYESGERVSIQGRNLNSKLKENGKYFVSTNQNNNIKATADNKQKSTIEITVQVPITTTFIVDDEKYAITNSIEDGKIGALPTQPTREGRTFEGWYDAVTGGTEYTSESTSTGDIKLYARWSVNVEFNTNGGSKVSLQKIEYKTTATRPTAPTKLYYTFMGWYLDSEFKNEVNFDEPVKNHTTLYAKWEETKYLGAAINTEKYGYRVKGYQPAVYNGYWRLFYQDENNTYIIAEPSKESYKPSDYYTSYENGTKVSEEGQRLNFKLKLNGNFFVATNTNNNIKATAWLTDTSSTSLWSLFYKDNVGLASYAIGSPTLELFIESYKSTHPSSAASITVDKNHTNYGYNSISNLDSISTTDNFGMYSSNKAWWIASPQYLNGKYMFNQGDGMVGATDATGNASYSTRPIVCIPTNKFNESCTLTNET